MNEEEAQGLLELAQAEQAGRSIAGVVRAFRIEMLKEMTTEMSVEAIDELTVLFGQAIFAKMALEELTKTVDQSED